MANGQGETDRVEPAPERDDSSAAEMEKAGQSEARASEAERGEAGKSEARGDSGEAGKAQADLAGRLKETEAELETVRRELEAAKGEVSEYRDLYLRLRAEFDNYRRRTRAEVEAMKSRAAEDLVAALLPVIDNLERAVEAAKKTEGAPKSLVDGVDMVLRQLMGELTAAGVSRIEALGAPFDPNWHEAVAYEETDEHPDGSVIEVFQTGYAFKEKLLRPCMVKVARARGGQEGEKHE